MNKIFNSFLSIAVATMVVYSASGATPNYGCDDDNNMFINPEIAMCSTHVYNVGGAKNTDNADERQLMQEVVALKATVITQQMKQQYDYLETTIKRLKTQLEKAVLTTKLQAAGAASDDVSSSGAASSGTGRNMYIAGVDNCQNKFSNSDVLTCLQTNYNVIYQLSDDGNNRTAAIKKQLEGDISILNSVLKNLEIGTVGNVCSQGNLSTKSGFKGCLDSLVNGIRTANSAAAKVQQQTATTPAGG